MRTNTQKFVSTVHFTPFCTCLCWLFSMAFAGNAQTWVSGSISGDWSAASSPYIVTGAVSVAGSLTIGEGVVVRFQSATSLTVSDGATLHVVGSAASPVLFTADDPAPTPGYWGGLQIISSSDYSWSTPNEITHATVEYAGNGIFCNSYHDGWIVLTASDVAIRYCSGNGIYAHGAGTTYGLMRNGAVRIALQDCRVYSNGQNGVYCEALAPWGDGWIEGSIANCIVASNSNGGIVATGSGEFYPPIANCVMYGNGGAGLENNCYGFASTLRNNIIAMNARGVADLMGTLPPQVVSFNDVWSNGTDWVGFVSGFDPATNHNVAVDPLLADPGSLDFHLRSQAGRYDPATENWVLDSVTSPCIDAGDPGSSFTNEPEPNGGRINMGAYGGTPFASKSLPRLTGVMLDSLTKDVFLSWSCAPTQTYRVVYSTALAGPWLNDLPNCQLTAGPSQTTLTYTNTAGGTQTSRFYRILWVAP